MHSLQSSVKLAYALASYVCYFPFGEMGRQQGL